MIHSRIVWMLRPVDRSMTVSAPQRVAHTSLSTSSATDEVTIELPILALTFTSKLRPTIIGSDSGWLTLFGMLARPRAISSRTNSRVVVGPHRRLADARLQIGLAFRHPELAMALPRDVDLARGREGARCHISWGDARLRAFSVGRCGRQGGGIGPGRSPVDEAPDL